MRTPKPITPIPDRYTEDDVRFLKSLCIEPSWMEPANWKNRNDRFYEEKHRREVPPVTEEDQGNMLRGVRNVLAFYGCCAVIVYGSYEFVSVLRWLTR